MLVIDDILMHYLFQSISIVIGDPRGQAILTEKDELMIEEKTLGHITEDDIWG